MSNMDTAYNRLASWFHGVTDGHYWRAYVGETESPMGINGGRVIELVVWGACMRGPKQSQNSVYQYNKWLAFDKVSWTQPGLIDKILGLFDRDQESEMSV
jgi:hypothetical protein